MNNSHFIGREPFKYHSFNSSPTDNSLSVCQFVELLRGERGVRLNSFHVDAVRAEEHYCLQCLVVRWFDVAYLGSVIQMVRCRKCGKESYS